MLLYCIANKDTVGVQWAVADLRHEVRVEGIRAVSWLCAAAWLLGIFGGITFEHWMGAGNRGVPQARYSAELPGAPYHDTCAR